jgi:hypothetical protein
MPTGELLKTRLYWASTSLIFFALPLLILVHGVTSRWTTTVRSEMKENSLQLREMLLVLREQEDTESYVPDLFRNTWRQIRADENPLRFLKTRLKALKRRFPGVFRFTVTDGQGRIVPGVTDGKPDPKGVFLLFQGLNKRDFLDGFVDNSLEVLRENWEAIRPFVGGYADPSQFEKQKNRLHEVNIGEKERWFTYLATAHFGWFAHINKPANWDDLALIDLVDRFSRVPRRRAIRAGFLNLQTMTPLPMDLPAVSRFRATLNPEIFSGGRQYFFMEIRTDSYLWASVPCESVEKLSQRQLQAVLLCTVLFGILSWFSFGVVIGRHDFRLSIRQRLLWLFFFAGGLPVTVLIMTGWDYLDEKVQARTRESFEQSEKILQSLDTNFLFMRGRIETLLREQAQTADLSSGKPARKLADTLKSLKGQMKAQDFMLYNRSGKLLWTATDGTSNSGDGGGVGKLVKNLLSTLNKETVKDGFDPVSLVLESLGGFGNPIQLMSRNINRLFRFSMAGGQKLWMFFGPIRDQENRASHMLRVYWKNDAIDRYFCQTAIPGLEKLNAPIEVFYANFEQKFVFSTRKVLPVRVKRFAQLLKMVGGTVSQRVTIAHEGYFLTGVKMKESEDGYLVALRPEKIIQKEIVAMRRNLWVFTVFMIGISLFLGHQLAQRFLEPITRLFEGVTALQGRRFDFRIPAMEPDEFGMLGETFNQVMVGMQDLDVGRIVQESLFPKEMLVAGNFRVFGTSSSAGELGGDYFDFQLLPDGKALVVIGDVSGHGLPAALVMAMARALMERECLIDASPVAILQALHRVILKTMKRKRMMTCFVGILDPRGQTFSFANAGHSFPYFYRNGEEHRQIEGGGTPLGAMKKLKVDLMTLEFTPGDKMFFYTDGLVEATVDGKQLGYKRMADGVGPLLGDDPQASCERVVTWHRGLTRHAALEDDITIVLITCSTGSA